MKKQTTVKIDADIVIWFKKESDIAIYVYPNINTILRGYIDRIETQRKAAGTPDPYFKPNLKPEKKKKGKK